LTLEVLRDSRYYEYDTPTRRKNTIEWFLHNSGPTKYRYFQFFSQEILPDLRATDSSGNSLPILPRKLISQAAVDRAEKLGVHVIKIRLHDVLAPGKVEVIRLQFVTAYKRSSVMKGKLRLIGHTDFQETFVRGRLAEDASSYLGIFVPKEYRLRVQESDPPAPKEVVHQDENSYIVRAKAPLPISYSIHIPRRVMIWLLLGVVFGLGNPLGAVLFFLSAPTMLAVANTLIIATIAGLITMRAWLFYSVELLDRVNYLYFVAILLCLGALSFIYYDVVTMPTPPLNR
jgi:hypothetical protein